MLMMIAATPAASVHAAALWAGAREGMSPADVRRVCSGAAAPAKPLVLSGGEVERLSLRDPTGGPSPAVVHFFFNGARLASVQLRPEIDGVAPASPQRAFEAWSSALTRRYGVGYDCGDKSFSDVAIYECKWLSGNVSIRFWYADVAGQAPLQYVSFRPASAPGFDA